jgi:ABC-type nickel/cobalt efflux system permease component RcnA
MTSFEEYKTNDLFYIRTILITASALIVELGALMLLMFCVSWYIWRKQLHSRKKVSRFRQKTPNERLKALFQKPP